VAYEVERKPGRFAIGRGAEHMRIAIVFGSLVVLSLVLSVALIVAGVPGIVPALALLVVCVVGVRFATDRMDQAVPWAKGGNAEAAIGEDLNALRADGFVVLHDLEEIVGGNIDHLVCGPTGVFMVETKFRSYRLAHLGRSKAVAAAVGRQLDVWVTPVICLATRSYGPIRHANVTILGRDELLPFLRSQRNATVAFERIAQLAERL
jgi:hypothetical protein